MLHGFKGSFYFLGTVRMVHLCLDETLCKHPIVIRGLSIVGNTPGIILKNPGKIMEISWNFVSPEMWEP